MNILNVIATYSALMNSVMTYTAGNNQAALAWFVAFCMFVINTGKSWND